MAENSNELRKQPTLAELNNIMDLTHRGLNGKLQSVGDVDGLCTEIIKTSPISGLTDDDVSDRRALYGPRPQTTVKGMKRSTFGVALRVVRESWKIFLTRTRFIVGIISLILTWIFVLLISGMYGIHLTLSWRSIIPILMTLFRFLLPGFLMEWVNRTTMSHFMGGVRISQGNDEGELTVLRNGVRRGGILKNELVVGDICFLPPSCVIPADGVLLDKDLPANSPQDPRVYFGTTSNANANAGECKMLVLAVGENTLLARNSKMGALSRSGILGVKLQSFSRLSIKFVVCLVVIHAVALIFLFYVPVIIGDHGWDTLHTHGILVSVTLLFYVLCLAVPDLIPLAIVTSLAVTCRRVAKSAKTGGAIIRSMNSLTTLGSATTVLISSDCLDNTNSSFAEIAEGIEACRSAGMSVRVLVPPNLSNLNFEEPFGIRGNEICVLNSCIVELIRSLIESGEVVAFISTGKEYQALHAANIGVVMYPNSPYPAPAISDINLSANDFRSFSLVLSRGRRVFEDITSVVQLYFPTLISLCVCDFANLFSETRHTDLEEIQIFWLFGLLFFLSLAHILSSEREIIPGRPSPGHSRLSFTTNTLRRNMAGQILYQAIAVIALVVVADSAPENIPNGFSGFMLNNIAWMTMFNGFNARKFFRERNVFEGLCLRDPFLWIWMGCAVLQTIGITCGGIHLSGPIKLTLSKWMISLLLGFGSLIWYQVWRLIPIPEMRQCVRRNFLNNSIVPV